MQTDLDLRRILSRIDGKGYKAYRDIRGVYRFPDYILFIDHVQGDPFAAPSRIRIRIDQKAAGFPLHTFENYSREIGLETYLCKRLHREILGKRKKAGSGKSGLIEVDAPGQVMLERTAVFVTDDFVEARIFMGLPASGRRILGREAEGMFVNALPAIVRESLFYSRVHTGDLTGYVETSEDADVLRDSLAREDLAAFIADGAILPRKSGVDDEPLTRNAVPFTSPDSFRVTFSLPNRGKITGMGIPRGVTLIVGGGFHGKSTLLNTLEQGVYNHIPGDGREFCVTSSRAVKIRAEDGRNIAGVDISPFISNIPFRESTTAFSTNNASGSTSQAANIMEALEAGCDLILMDEDTSATNFLIRDHRMQELIHKDREPITPFIDKVKQLHADMGTSSILVFGGSGDYFDVADHVIAMQEYLPRDMTRSARRIAEKFPAQRVSEGGASFGRITRRRPVKSSLNASRGKRDVSIKVHGRHTIQFGVHTIDLSAVGQIVESGQTRALAAAVHYAGERYIDGRKTLEEVLDSVMNDLDRFGLDVLDKRKPGNLTRFRRFELAAALNRLRTLQVTAE